MSLPDLVARTEGYSGADLHLVCRDASLAKMRQEVAGKSPLEIVALKEAGRLDGELTAAAFEAALRTTTPTVSADELGAFAAWDSEFGSK